MEKYKEDMEYIDYYVENIINDLYESIRDYAKKIDDKYDSYDAINFEVENKFKKFVNIHEARKFISLIYSNVKYPREKVIEEIYYLYITEDNNDEKKYDISDIKCKYFFKYQLNRERKGLNAKY